MPLEVARRLEQAERHAALLQQIDLAVRAHQHGRDVAGVDVEQASRRHVEHHVEERDVAPLLDRLVKEAVRAPHDRAHGQLVADQRGDGGPDGGHQQGRGDALAHDVGDHHAPAVLRQGDELVVVAAHRQRRLVRPGDVEPVQRRGGPRQQVLHHVAGQREVAVETALVAHLGDEPGVLDGRGDARGVDADQRRGLVVVAGRAVGPEVERPPHPAAGADERHDQPGMGPLAPFAHGRLVVQRDRLAAGQGAAHDPVPLERRRHVDRHGIGAAAGEAVGYARAEPIDDVDGRRVVVDERHQAVQDAGEDAPGVAAVGGQAERLDQDARAGDRVFAEPDRRPAGAARGIACLRHGPIVSSRARVGEPRPARTVTGGGMLR